MNAARRLFISVAVGSSFLMPTSSFAQISVGSIDSFFDIYQDISLPKAPATQFDHPDCITCDDIVDAIMDTQATLQHLGAEADKLLAQHTVYQGLIQTMQASLALLEADLTRIQSEDFVRDETTGETETARNQAARKAYRNDTYQQWKAGDISSEEKMQRDSHSYEMTESELAKWYKNAKADTESEIKTMKEQIESMQGTIDDILDDLEDVLDDIEAGDATLSQLLDALEDCWKMCIDGPVSLNDLEIMPEPLPPLHDGPFGKIQDWIFGIPDIALVPPSDPFNVDSFFDIFVDIPLPEATCPFCDPLRNQIAAMQKDATALQTRLTAMKADLTQANRGLAQAERELATAQQAWDRMNSDDFVTNHSTGVTETARDQAARREFRRNSHDYSQTGSDLTEAELNRWAQKAEARLQAELAAAKKMVNAARTKTKGIQDAMQNIADQLAASQKALSARMESLAQCEASCKNMDELNRTLEDVSVLTPPTSFEPSGYFCSIPVIRSVTCGEDDNEGWMCNTFNLFCPEEEFFIDDALACITGASSSLCDSIGTEPQFFIEGALGTEFPLIISGMDGDINALQHCLSNGPEDCTGLDFGLPGEDILFGNDFLNADPGDFHLGVHGPNDDGFLLGDPIDSDLINVGGGSNDILFGGPVALSDDLIGPGDDSILGGPPSVDILGDPPPQSEPSVANDPRARQVAQAAVDAYLQRNPLQPCEKLVVSVSRVRIGKRVRYTVKITRDRDEALCPKQCTKDGGFENMAACQSACPDPSRCGYDGGTCWLCNRGDESSCQKDNGFNSMEACRAGCNNPESCGYDGSLCYVCGLYDDDDRDLCKDVECDDGDECTEDACNPDTGECTNTPIDGCGDPECGNGVVEAGEECESNVDCKFDQQCNPESCACERMEIISNAKCPDLSYATQNECRQACSGSCQYKQYEDIWCFFCYSEDLWGGSSSSKRSVDEQCDSPMKKKADCERSCDGKCHKSYTTISGLECYECQEVQPVCGDGTFIDECPSSCSSGCDVASSQNGVTCYQCAQSCEDVCSQNGYHTEDYDHSSAILSELNGYSCVSGANISIQTATIGSCHCIGEYSLSVNQTPPVCTGTPCGDVTCNSSASCTDGDTTITVNCSWGGWEKIGKEQFRPKVGN